MKLMIDSNIILDHIGRREPFYEASRKVCLLGLTGEAETFISASMITDLYYILRKDYGSQEAQRMIEEDLGFLKIVSASSEDVSDALSQRWNDFEDCLVSICAKKVGADFIITRNAKDFKRSSIKAISPESLFDELSLRGFNYEEIEWV